MKTKFQAVVFLLLILAITVRAQSGNNGIFLCVPEADTTITTYSQYRLSGGAAPGSRVLLNGTELKVYPTGAFAGALPLDYGMNEFTLTSIEKSGKQLSHKFYIMRSEPMRTTPDSILAIESMMEPNQNLLMQEGEYLKIRFKGTPNCRAYAFGNVKIDELPASQTKGIGGIYQAYIKMKPEYFRPDSLVLVSLINQFGEDTVAAMPGKIAFLSSDYPLIGVTKGDMPSLSFGLGGDRLGGAKMGYITDKIKLKITGKVGSNYRVQLTDNNEAWINEDFVDLQPKGTYVPSTALTGSWRVSGDEKYDYVYIGLSERVPYYTYQEINPNKIIIDLYGTASNSNWITQMLSAKEIKNVYYTEPAKDLFRVTIELKSKQSWGYGISYEGNTLLVKVKHTPKKLKIGKLKFAIDAGHGGEGNNGALGSTGLLEKDINLSIAKHLKEALEDEGAQVYMTRSKDTLVYNSDRLKRILRESDVDLAISIHCNSIGESSNPEDTKGTSVYYKHIFYKPLTGFIYKEMLDLKLAEFGQVGSFNFYLNSPTDIPSVLVETAFMSHPEDEMKLMDDDFRKEVAEKIVNGVEEFLDYCDE